MSKSEIVEIRARVKPSHRTALQKMAKANGRSLTAEVGQIIGAHLNKLKAKSKSAAA